MSDSTVLDQIDEDTCTTHRRFCCAECFDMTPIERIEMNPESKIVSARIEEAQGLFGGHSKVHVTLESGEELVAVNYYADEIHFTASEFIGLTLGEARDLHMRKDMAYLRS